MVESDIKNVETGLLVATFQIGMAWFCIDAHLVQEVIQVKKSTPVHHAPAFICGVMNLRGKVITVIDLGEKLAFGEITRSEDNRILIVEWKQEYIGLLVERITEVVHIESDLIRDPPGNVHGVQATLITGVFQNNEGFLVGLLNIDKILEIDDRPFGELQKNKND
jgi:purine-binding chemotaxis protein CheW